MFRESFPGRLKNARIKAGYTQKEVQEETGIERSRISYYENGKREPDIETLGELATLYGVSTDWLLGITPKSNKENN